MLKGKSMAVLEREIGSTKEYLDFDGPITLGNIRNGETVTIAAWIDTGLSADEDIYVTWIGGRTTFQPHRASEDETSTFGVFVVIWILIVTPLILALKMYRQQTLLARLLERLIAWQERISVTSPSADR